MEPPGFSKETKFFLISGGNGMRYTIGAWLADGSAGSALFAVLLPSVSVDHGVHAAGSVVGVGDGYMGVVAVLCVVLGVLRLAT